MSISCITLRVKIYFVTTIIDYWEFLYSLFIDVHLCYSNESQFFQTYINIFWSVLQLKPNPLCSSQSYQRYTKLWLVCSILEVWICPFWGIKEADLWGWTSLFLVNDPVLTPKLYSWHSCWGIHCNYELVQYPSYFEYGPFFFSVERKGKDHIRE